MVKNWQGYWRCPEHNEPRQPQDFVRGEADVQTVPWAQPPTKTYIEICTIDGISAVPGEAEPGCMVPGNRLFSGGFASAPVIQPPISLPGAPTIVSVS